MQREQVERIVLLTGVTRGLGRAMADELARLGHRVLGCGRDANAVALLRAAYGAPHDFDVVDVADDQAVARWVARLTQAHGPPDLVLNNAALINRSAPLWRVPPEELSLIVDVNVKGTVNVIRHVVPAMIGRGRGVIVNFSSGWGRSTDRDVAPYCATKFAVEGLTQALAQELPAGLATVAVNPGIVNTDMLRSCFGDGAADYESPAEWARRAVPFLLGLGPAQNGRPLRVPHG
jgi:NAD(P)-dependent dehydrogenase (short-subunit alcohol dehydrogenase family)